MKSKIALILVFVLGISMFAGMAAAQDYPADSWFGRIISNFKYNQQDYSVYGDELGCSVYPDEVKTFKNGQSAGFSVPVGDSAFVNLFRGSPYNGAYPEHPTISRQFLEEDFISGQQIAYACDAGAYWNNDCYVEIYRCPEAPCYSDSECSTGETCDKTILSTKIPGAGVCRATQPTHKTKVYLCEDGDKTYVGEVSYGSLDFCNDQATSRYYLTAENTDSCLDYEPSACIQSITQPICGDSVCNGQETCDTCSNDCGVCQTVGCTNRNTEADVDCDRKLSKSEIINYKIKWRNGEVSRTQLGVTLEAWVQENE